MLGETQLKLKHAAAYREKDEKTMRQCEKELAKMGVIGEWVTETMIVWHKETVKKRGRPRKK